MMTTILLPPIHIMHTKSTYTLNDYSTNHASIVCYNHDTDEFLIKCGLHIFRILSFIIDYNLMADLVTMMLAKETIDYAMFQCSNINGFNKVLIMITIYIAFTYT